jgi:hypothetical protein
LPADGTDNRLVGVLGGQTLVERGAVDEGDWKGDPKPGLLGPVEKVAEAGVPNPDGDGAENCWLLLKSLAGLPGGDL